MKLNEYQKLAARTAKTAEMYEAEGAHAPKSVRQTVAALGLAGEAGEFVDLYKKVIGHGQALDAERMQKELGDVLWYAAELCTAHGWSLEDVAAGNIKKLRTRYPEKFSNEQSAARVDVNGPGVGNE